ncbi:MAG: hypothetical protein P8J51_00515 [Dehalococcoidia bacterium]|nr:hypothetical protein [Dehalococcoidia bacterium]
MEKKLNIKKLFESLNTWHKHNKIIFPWDKTEDPYYAFVAGYCAQQTQISRVIILWKKFIEAYPTIEILANANTADLLTIWGNAGYPKRALSMQNAAQIILKKNQGIIPKNITELTHLPGIGPYTASVILAFGYKQNVPTIDINFKRILGRYFLGDELAKDKDIKKITDLLTKESDYHFWNSAIMDFGSLMCTSRPKCEICIMNINCKAFLKPTKEIKKKNKKKVFIGSNRYYRGKILKLLRERKTKSIDIKIVYRELKKERINTEKINKIIKSLNDDSLIYLEKEILHLG